MNKKSFAIAALLTDEMDYSKVPDKWRPPKWNILLSAKYCSASEKVRTIGGNGRTKIHATVLAVKEDKTSGSQCTKLFGLSAGEGMPFEMRSLSHILKREIDKGEATRTIVPGDCRKTTLLNRD